MIDLSCQDFTNLETKDVGLVNPTYNPPEWSYQSIWQIEKLINNHVVVAKAEQRHERSERRTIIIKMFNF